MKLLEQIKVIVQLDPIEFGAEFRAEFRNASRPDRIRHP